MRLLAREKNGLVWVQQCRLPARKAKTKLLRVRKRIKNSMKSLRITDNRVYRL